MNIIAILTCLVYLQEIELDENFVPWDCDGHAITNLQTVFEVSEKVATTAVRAFRPTVKHDRDYLHNHTLKGLDGGRKYCPGCQRMVTYEELTESSYFRSCGQKE